MCKSHCFPRTMIYECWVFHIYVTLLEAIQLSISHNIGRLTIHVSIARLGSPGTKSSKKKTSWPRFPHLLWIYGIFNDVYQRSSHIKPKKELLGLLGVNHTSEIRSSFHPFPTKVATLRLHRVDQHPSFFPGLRGVAWWLEIWGSFLHILSISWCLPVFLFPVIVGETIYIMALPG